MESQFLTFLPDVLDWCYKDPYTVFLLRRSQQSVTLQEMDIALQTISKQKEAPLFEGVQEDAQRYHLLYHEQSLLLIYPVNIIVRYSVGESELTLESVVQSLYTPLTMPYILGNGGLAFNCDGSVIIVNNIDELSKKKVNKIPINSGKVNLSLTDIAEIASDIWAFGLTNGQILVHYGKSSFSFGFDTLREQIGEQKPYQVNSLHFANNLLLVADAFGRLSVMEL